MGFEESSGVAKAGLTTGVIGTALSGLLALGGNGGGFFGRRPLRQQQCADGGHGCPR